MLNVESRKAWRNRAPSAGEAVLALLETLRAGLGADSVGLFDDDRAEPAGPAGAGAGDDTLNFWDAFEERPCGEIDWQSWYRTLKANARVETACGCRGKDHRLHGFLVHGRWALLLVAPPTLPGDGAAAIASSLAALSARLPPARSAAEREAALRYDGLPAASSSPTGPAWWVRRRPQ